ncbi:MAG TPA: class I SAM-dependent methyltransferase [Novosphingobium sp.]|nr:class I SAM-dependent methyltransferase [Novosphingobium sp.]
MVSPTQRRTGRLARWPRLQRLAGFVRRVTSPTLRTVHRLQHQSAELLQPFPDTMPDRHPALFAHARRVLAENPGPRLLSFGCSTGEEPLTLLRYLPEAQIDAVEINPRSIAIARKRANEAGCSTITFHQSGLPPRDTSYDAVFCLSVLRHGELDAAMPALCTQILPFRRFDETLQLFDQILKTGGHLYVWGSNFRFSDSSIAPRYQPIMLSDAPPHPGAIYGSDDRLIDSRGNTVFVFRKERSAASA